MSILEQLVNVLESVELKRYVEINQKIKDLECLLRQSEYCLLLHESQIKHTRTHIEFLQNIIKQFKNESTNIELKANVVG